MSGAPPRTEAERRAIAEEAHRRWEAAGYSGTNDVDIWLEAEAFLQAVGIITRRPLTLPVELIFTADGIDDEKSTNAFTVIVQSSSSPSLVHVSATNVGKLDHQSYLLRPEVLAHEYRLVALQVIAISAAADRIARFAEITSTQLSPDPTFFDYLSDEEGKKFQLKSCYHQALLEPDEFPDRVAAIDSAISNQPIAFEMSADVDEISFGSSLEIAMQLMAMGPDKALVFTAIATGMAFTLTYATVLGKRLANLTADKIIGASYRDEKPRKGVRGKASVSSKSKKDILEAIERAHQMDPGRKK